MRKGIHTLLCLAAGILTIPFVASADDGFLRLEDGLAEKHANDIKGLYFAWIANHPGRKSGWFGEMTQPRQRAAEENLWQGMQEFCRFSGGQSRKESVPFVPGYERDAFSCLRGGEIIGRLTYWNHTDGRLGIAWSNAESIRRHAKQRSDEIEDLRLARTQNGPTGWVTTADDRRLRIRRFGTTKESLVLRFGDLKPTEVRELRFLEAAGAADVLLSSREVARIQTGDINDTSYDGYSFQSRGLDGLDGFPVVIEHRDGRLEERRFPFFRGIKKIEIDDYKVWATLPGGTIPSSERHPGALDGGAENSNQHQVGDKVCRLVVDSEIRRPVGVVVGGVPIHSREQGIVTLVAFVERLANQKVQLRVASVLFKRAGISDTEQLGSFQLGNVTIKVDNIIWEAGSDWRRCD